MEQRRGKKKEPTCARKSAAASAGGINIRRIALACAAAEMAAADQRMAEAEDQEEMSEQTCRTPLCGKRLHNRFARYCEDNSLCQRYRAVKLQCQEIEEKAAMEEGDDDDKPLALPRPKARVKVAKQKKRTRVRDGGTDSSILNSETQENENDVEVPFVIPRRKPPSIIVEAASGATGPRATSSAPAAAVPTDLAAEREMASLALGVDATNISSSQGRRPKRRRKKKLAQEQTQAKALQEKRKEQLQHARDAVLAAIQRRTSSSSEARATSEGTRSRKRSLHQQSRDPHVHHSPDGVEDQETDSETEAENAGSDAPDPKKRRLERHVNVDGVSGYPAPPFVATAASLLPQRRPVVRGARTTQAGSKPGMGLVPLGIANQTECFAGGGRYVQSGNRSARQSMREPTHVARLAGSTTSVSSASPLAAPVPPPRMRPVTALVPPPLPPSAEPARTGITAWPSVPQRGHQDSSTAGAVWPRPGASTLQRISTARCVEQLNNSARLPGDQGTPDPPQSRPLERATMRGPSAEHSGLPPTPSSYQSRRLEYPRNDNPPLPFVSSSTTGSRRSGAVGDEAFPRQLLNHGDGVHRMDPRRCHAASGNHGEFSENGVYPGGEWESRHFPPPPNHFPLRQNSVLWNHCSSDGRGFAYAVDSYCSPSSFPVQPSSYWQNRLQEEPRETLVCATTASVAPPPPQPAVSSGGIESRSTESTAQSRSHCDALAIDSPTFSYHDSFLSRLLSQSIQKLPDELQAVMNKTKKPRKMNWYVQYAKRIERVCQPYVRVMVQNLKAVVTVQDREWLSLEGSSSVVLYTEVIKRMRAEAIAWRELKSEVEKALTRCRDRSVDDGSRAFLSAWRNLKNQQGNTTSQDESMSLPLQGNYFRGTRLHHWNFVFGRVEIGSGSHEENREAYRLAAVSALSFLLDLDDGHNWGRWRPIDFTREARHERPRTARESPREHQGSSANDPDTTSGDATVLAVENSASATGASLELPIAPEEPLMPSTDSISGQEPAGTSSNDAVESAPSSMPAVVDASAQSAPTNAMDLLSIPNAEMEVSDPCSMCDVIRMRKSDGARCLRCQTRSAIGNNLRTAGFRRHAPAESIELGDAREEGSADR